MRTTITLGMSHHRASASFIASTSKLSGQNVICPVVTIVAHALACGVETPLDGLPQTVKIAGTAYRPLSSFRCNGCSPYGISYSVPDPARRSATEYGLSYGISSPSAEIVAIEADESISAPSRKCFSRNSPCPFAKIAYCPLGASMIATLVPRRSTAPSSTTHPTSRTLFGCESSRVGTGRLYLKGTVTTLPEFANSRHARKQHSSERIKSRLSAHRQQGFKMRRLLFPIHYRRINFFKSCFF